MCAVALLGVLGQQQLHADDGVPIDMGGDECVGIVPHAPTGLTRGTITADVVIALDGVSLQEAKQVVATGSTPYAAGVIPQLSPDVKINVLAYHDITDRLKGNVVSGFVVDEEPDGSDLMSQLIRYYRATYPNLKRHHVHLLTNRDIAAELTPGREEPAVAGIANCIGGVGTEYAYAITEVGVFDPVEIGPLTAMKDLDAKNFAHEMGHVFGAHHHYAECASHAPLGLADRTLDTCSVMFNDLSLLSLQFSAVETAAIRGFAEAHIAGTNPLP